MKKYFAFILGLGLVLPMNCLALESTDLAVELGEDMKVDVGEKFSISVKSAYDKTESCGQFFYDWRQSKGPITVTPLNNDVLAPEFQINTAGEYVFSLAIETRCDDENVRSEADTIKVTVAENEEAETKNYENFILPSTVSLTADGESSWDLNFYLEGESEKPDGENVEFTLSSEDETLQENLGTLETLSMVTEKGLIALTYTAPEINSADWTGGNVQIEAKSAYGSATAEIVLEAQTESYVPELTVVQTVNDLPYLVQNHKALGLLSVDILNENETEIGVVDIFLNEENIYHEEKIFFQEWTDTQKENYENYVSFYFTPVKEENVFTAMIEIGGEIITLKKEVRAYSTDGVELEIVALAEGKWADESTVDLSETLAEGMKLLQERVPAEISTLNPLEQTPVITTDDIQEKYLVVFPEGYGGEILTDRSLNVDGTRYELAQAYFRIFENDKMNTISDIGVLIDSSESDNINDKGFEVVNAETPSILSSGGGIGLPYDLAWANLAELRVIGTFADLQRSHWSYDYMRNLIGRGIISGYADATVRPDQEITRAEFVKILLSAGRIDAGEAQENVNFSDVSKIDWSMPYIEQAVRYGLVGGYDDGTFRPNRSITRAEAVKILAEYLGLETSEGDEGVFSDVEAEAWYAPYVEAIYEAGIVSGYADGTFGPNKSITRAEAGKIIKVAIFGE